MVICCHKDTEIISARRSVPMSLQGRIEELSKRHAQIDEKIDEEQKRPARNDIVLRDLKRQKLRLKEEIGILRAS
ncbi:MAG: YdcH family protein [Henriciella sp.]